MLDVTTRREVLTVASRLPSAAQLTLLRRINACELLATGPGIYAHAPAAPAVIGTATWQYDATGINALAVHAIDTQRMRPLCTDKLTVLSYEPGTAATSDNTTCQRCRKKLSDQPVSPSTAKQITTLIANRWAAEPATYPGLLTVTTAGQQDADTARDLAHWEALPEPVRITRISKRPRGLSPISPQRPLPAGRNVRCYFEGCPDAGVSRIVWFTNESGPAAEKEARIAAARHAMAHIREIQAADMTSFTAWAGTSPLPAVAELTPGRSEFRVAPAPPPQ